MQHTRNIDLQLAAVLRDSCPTLNNFNHLAERYDLLRTALELVGGGWGVESVADELHDQMERIADAVSSARARTRGELIQKIRIGLDLIDPSDETARELFRSVLVDLDAGAAHRA